MFTIYHSHQSDAFINLMIDIMSNKSSLNPIQSEMILTEHNDLGMITQWIQIKLAKHFGISANITFMSIISFIRNVLIKALWNNSSINYFSQNMMYWIFMNILSEIHLIQPDCIFIIEYLKYDQHQRKQSQLSKILANLFNQYLIYRPDWLENWQCNKTIDELKNNNHQIWQSKLWRIFLTHIKYDNQQETDINFLKRCIHYLQRSQKINYHLLPNRIFIFCITSLPPIFWKILELLSHHIDIYLWFMTPYQYTWDLSNKKNIFYVKASCMQLYNNDHFQYNIQNNSYHPILNSWGFIGYNTLHIITQLKNIHEIKKFLILQEDSLLHILQKDILEFQNYTKNANVHNHLVTSKNKKRYLLKSTDQSITFHVCYSIQREIEILHDNLLLMFINNPSLSPGDILVMAPDIHHYISAINSVFNNVHNRYIPFTISNTQQKHMHPVTLAFLTILDLPHSRCTAEEILSLLKTPLVAACFNISLTEIEILYQWTIKSGIRWGLDEITMRDLNLPITNQNTWYFGFIRILLGYSMRNQNEVWSGISPYNDTTTENNIHIIEQLGKFLKRLQKWRNTLSHNYTLTTWTSHINEIFNDFFYNSNMNREESRIIFLLRTHCLNILETGIQLEYTKNINVIVLRDMLYNKLKKNKINYKFLPNVINFCNITPPCCIPFKVICFLGMNNTSFPRCTTSLDFNMMIKNPRNNDKNMRNQDRYSFLLTLLSAQERIYISYIGGSMYDDTINYPSILISELCEYIAQLCYISDHEHLNINAKIEHIHQYLFQWYSRVPFHDKNFISDEKYKSFAKEWLPLVNKVSDDNHSNCTINHIVYPHIITSSIKKNQHIILFHDLYNFYRHPIKVWCQKYLNVHINNNSSQLLNNESFIMNALDQYNINSKLIDYLIYNKDINELYNNIHATGILPHAAFGELYWINQYNTMLKLANQIKPYYSSTRYHVDICIIFDTIKLVGQLNLVQSNGLLRWKPTGLSIKDGLLLWLEHLIYCAIGGTGDSQLFGIDNIWHFPNFSQSLAKKLLFFYISGYCLGMTKPLPLLYKSGGIWINYIFDRNTKTISLEKDRQNKAYQKLIQSWQGVSNSHSNITATIQGEYHDPYLRALIPFHLNQNDIHHITKTAESYLYNIMKYRII